MLSMKIKQSLLIFHLLGQFSIDFFHLIIEPFSWEFKHVEGLFPATVLNLKGPDLVIQIPLYDISLGESAGLGQWRLPADGFFQRATTSINQ